MPDAFNTTAFAGRNDEVMKVKQDDNKFEVTLDVSDYKPEELKVTTVNNVLSIEGKHEAKTEDSKDYTFQVWHLCTMGDFNVTWYFDWDFVALSFNLDLAIWSSGKNRKRFVTLSISRFI